MTSPCLRAATPEAAQRQCLASALSSRAISGAVRCEATSRSRDRPSLRKRIVGTYTEQLLTEALGGAEDPTTTAAALLGSPTRRSASPFRVPEACLLLQRVGRGHRGRGLLRCFSEDVESRRRPSALDAALALDSPSVRAYPRVGARSVGSSCTLAERRDAATTTPETDVNNDWITDMVCKLQQAGLGRKPALPHLSPLTSPAAVRRSPSATGTPNAAARSSSSAPRRGVSSNGTSPSIGSPHARRKAHKQLTAATAAAGAGAGRFSDSPFKSPAFRVEQDTGAARPRRLPIATTKATTLHASGAFGGGGGGAGAVAEQEDAARAHIATLEARAADVLRYRAMRLQLAASRGYRAPALNIKYDDG